MTDHKAAKELAEKLCDYPDQHVVRTLSRAYLNLTAQLAARDKAVNKWMSAMMDGYIEYDKILFPENHRTDGEG